MNTQLVATAWTSAGDTSPMLSPATSPVPVAERLQAIVEAGYVGFGLIADDLLAVRDSIGFAALRDMAADHGLSHIEIELLERWWIPPGRPGHTYDVRGLLFEAARVLNPVFIKIGSENGPPLTDLAPLVAPLRELADEAARLGTRIAIETMPFSRIATVPMGAELVTAADHLGVGLLVDAWHVFRAGTSLSELDATLPDGMIFGVELDDAAPEVVGTLFEDTVERRLLCGEGAFDLTGLIGLLRAKGFDGPWGVEILSEDLRQLPVRQALQQAADTARKILG
ncbi:sugar phosphate isomerase/epimerase [Mycobacterium sp. 236(2023)]|uniref:sugar phosphate isomerase/epimerase family protein n=1 Tax=Mycobacterium sp. 236(2023) TaxID=3038163 RepID=UPI0024150408|nr:sugar phosphate isomerase/epimerase [Mycobacterium sp. 236(2023)]MDG4667760.1 sugar phosphate isomerase/epimerase [Mycobacterium sp. 236(2023)]